MVHWLQIGLLRSTKQTRCVCSYLNCHIILWNGFSLLMKWWRSVATTLRDRPLRHLLRAMCNLGSQKNGFLPSFSSIHEMQKNCRNGYTFAALLKACAKRKDVERGIDLHAKAAKLGLLEKDPFLGTTVVDMYAKCGSLLKAHGVFNELPFRDAVLWNALISGYAEHGHGEEALKCLERMKLEGILPSAVTFTCSLKSCASSRSLNKGKELHVQIEQEGLMEQDIIVGNGLVDLYAKCGSLATAKQVLRKLPVQDVFTWTALLAGYVECGHSEEALVCFEQMQVEGVAPNNVTFVCTLKACANVGHLDKGRDLHAQIGRSGLLEKDLAVGNALVDMYVKCGSLAAAKEVFDMLRDRDVISWTALITGYLEHGHSELALECFERMRLEGVHPNIVTIISSLNACSSIGAMDKGRILHAQMEDKEYFERDLVVGTTLVNMYAKCGSLAIAQKLFDNLRARDVILWTALIEGYIKHGYGEAALRCFTKMQLEGVSPDVFTFVCSLKACGSIGATEKGQEIHAEIERLGLIVDSLSVGNTLVDMYAKCDRLTLARQVFDGLPTRDVDSWNPLIAGYAHAGESGDVLHLLECMSREGITPDPVTFVFVLNACSHTGMCSKSHTYFEAMSEDFGIVPALAHHNSMVDIHCRAGELDKARAIIEKMPLSPDPILWRTVLGACRRCGSLELARQAFEHAVCLNGKDAAAFIMMSQIHADVDKER